MGYQALLFCPDEKTARTVTQVLGELEFSVEACTEPFAAVKKLMGEHFDAVVVDCDNEQNATLLFKSARNSTSNQTSLAVAVVEGQAGVAKAFRIGANLVLTKPINIEQTKGTLRVARGLLRKADPTKPASAPAPSATAPVPKPAPKAASPMRPASPIASVPVAPPAPKEIPAAWPAAAVAKSAPAAQANELFEQPVERSAPVVAPTPVAAAPESVISNAQRPSDIQPSPAVPFASSSYPTSGAASAPAPAREPQVSKPAETIAESTISAPAKAFEATVSEPAHITGSAPTFSYGGASDSQSGGSKKIFIGIAAVVVLGIAGYFGWSQLKSHNEASATPQATTQPSGVPTQSAKPNSAQPAASTVTPAPVETAKASPSVPNTAEIETEPKESATHPTAKPEKSSTTSAKPTHEEKAEAETETAPEPEPILVKSGKAPATNTKAATADSAAPSLIGMATPASAPPPDLVPSTNLTFKPVLQTVSVSQGVSQGLLYKKVAPTYPSGALRMRLEGKVELMATISKEGNITQVKVLSGDGQLSKAAADAVKQWKYKPYLLNGEPVEIQTQVTVNFKLPN
jgi:TonB family protein